MANEAELRKHRCCFTGHRPEKLHKPEEQIKKDLEQTILQAVDDGFVTFISGMARGVDIWAAEIVLDMRRDNPELRLICALPHPNFEQSWRMDWRNRYNAIRAAADLERTISPVYSKAAYQKRNVWMVDHSALVIAVFNGESGGTLNTIRYAQQNQVEIMYAE